MTRLLPSPHCRFRRLLVALPTRAAINGGRRYPSSRIIARRKRHHPTTAFFATEGGGEEGSSPVGETQTAKDDTPIFYIRGLEDGGGVGAWGDDSNTEVDEGEVRKALRNVRQGKGEGEGDAGSEEVEEVQPDGFDWERVRYDGGTVLRVFFTFWRAGLILILHRPSYRPLCELTFFPRRDGSLVGFSSRLWGELTVEM